MCVGRTELNRWTIASKTGVLPKKNEDYKKRERRGRKNREKASRQCQMNREEGRPWREPHPLLVILDTSIYPSGAHLASEIIVIIVMTTLIIMMNNDNTYNRGSAGGLRSCHMYLLCLLLVCSDVVYYAGNRTQGLACVRLVLSY